VTAATRQSPERQVAYPNELPNLKIYEHAKWKTLKPYVSTFDDIQKLLGKPVPVYDELLHTFFAGYQDDPDWIIVIDVVDRNAELPDSVVGRVLTIELYPKNRVSLVGADFSAFRGATYSANQEVFTSYYDRFGLRYVVYEKESADRRFQVGDLKRIDYGPSDAETERLKRENSARRKFQPVVQIVAPSRIQRP